MVSGGVYTTIGNGNARVWVEYRAEKDHDNRGDFWDIDWDNTRVHLGDTDITNTLCEESWKHIEEKIQKDLE